MYVKNNRGPKLLPYGTPQVILAVSDNSWPEMESNMAAKHVHFDSK
jgi:hypothetical protein